MSTLLKNVRLPDGQITDIRYDEKILEIGPDLDISDSLVRDCTGLTVLPGLIDVHVHLREPGHAQKETIATGTAAAAHGGFTTVFAMPNVLPFPSTPEVMEDYLKLIERDARVHVIPYGTITRNEAGQELTDYAAMPLRYFSDDGVGVADGNLMKAALQKNAEQGLLFACHTEDMAYRKPGASVHDGDFKQDWIGIPSACETAQLQRDLDLMKETGGTYHACHISAKESVEAIQAAKDAGLDVSGEVTAHHLLLCDADVKGPNWKMNPPLRSDEDRQALIRGLETGALDMIANDHAPHTAEEKGRSMEQAPFGIVSLETAFPLLYTEFVATGKWSLSQLVHWMSEAPARRFGLEDRGRLEPGLAADLVLIDENRPGVVDKSAFLSMGKNTPFDGWKTACTIVETIVAGNPAWKEGN